MLMTERGPIARICLSVGNVLLRTGGSRDTYRHIGDDECRLGRITTVTATGELLLLLLCLSVAMIQRCPASTIDSTALFYHCFIITLCYRSTHSTVVNIWVWSAVNQFEGNDLDINYSMRLLFEHIRERMASVKHVQLSSQQIPLASTHCTTSTLAVFIQHCFCHFQNLMESGSQTRAALGLQLVDRKHRHRLGVSRSKVRSFRWYLSQPNNHMLLHQHNRPQHYSKDIRTINLSTTNQSRWRCHTEQICTCSGLLGEIRNGGRHWFDDVHNQTDSEWYIAAYKNNKVT